MSAEQIIDLYTRLRRPDCTETDEITNALMQFYHNPEAINVLAQIINESTDEHIRESAAVGVKEVIRFVFRDLPDQAAFFRIILSFSLSSSPRVRDLNDLYIQTCLNESLLPVVDEFVNSIAQNMTPLNASVIMKMIVRLIAYNYHPAVQEQATQICLASPEPEIKLPAFLALFNQFNLMEEVDESATECFSAAVAFLSEIAPNEAKRTTT